MKILLLLLLTSCQVPPLMEKEFYAIHNQPYKIHVWDCSNKSALYAITLHRAGYTDVVVKVFTTRLKYNHAVVYANGIYHCPTSGFTAQEEWEINKTYGGKFSYNITIPELEHLKTIREKEWNYEH